jgi:pimeloyl-ACP methyl ester carboxylesterase
VLPNSDAASNDRVVPLGDGRAIGYREYGDFGGFPVVALHGTPGSRLKYAGGHDGAIAGGLRVIALDRWGYGLSSAKPDPALADYGRDVEVLADRLGLERFAVTGVSGGAPYAVATAAVLKERVSALALVSPVGVIDGPAGIATLSWFHTLCFQIAPTIPGLIGGSFQAYRAVLAVAPDLAMQIAVLKSARADRAIIRDERARSGMAEMFAEGLAAGVGGPVTDMALFGRPWGIEWANVCGNVRIWMGAEDRNVPVSAVHALQGALPSSELIEVADAGHQWLTSNHEAVWGWINESARQ